MTSTGQTKRKIKVALMTYTIDGRRAKGTARVARASVEAVLRHLDEFEPTFIHYEQSDDPIYSHGIREVILPHIPIKFFDRHSIRQAWYFWRTKDRYDIVHWYQPRLYPFFWLAPARYIVVTLHGAGDTKKENNFVWTRYMHNYVIKWFKRYIAIGIAGSDYSMRDIVHSYGIPQEKLRVVNNGVDPKYAPQSKEEIARVRKKYDLPEKFFLGVARMIPNKNVPRVLRAFLSFAAKDSEGFSYVNVGAQGPDSREVDTLLASDPNSSRVRLIPYIDEEDLPAVYAASFALTSLFHGEGFALPAVEGMACGAPTILSKNAQPEFSEDDAVLVDVGDEADIERGMRQMAMDAALRERLAVNGPIKAKQFPWTATGEKVVEIYRELTR